MSCKVNKGPHTFYHTLADKDTRVGKNLMYHIITWHTCIACGVRRAITEWGELIVKIKGEWEVRETDE